MLKEQIMQTQRPMSLCLLHNRIFFISKGILEVPQLTRSPDLSPHDFFLFSKLKNAPKESDFRTLKNIQKKTVTDMLKTIPIDNFQRCYQTAGTTSPSGFTVQRNYFEGGQH